MMKVSAYLQNLVTGSLLFAISVTFAIDVTFTAKNPTQKGMQENLKNVRGYSINSGRHLSSYPGYKLYDFDLGRCPDGYERMDGLDDKADCWSSKIDLDEQVNGDANKAGCHENWPSGCFYFIGDKRIFFSTCDREESFNDRHVPVCRKASTTASPTTSPTSPPTVSPTVSPSSSPTASPSSSPTVSPSSSPTAPTKYFVSCGVGLIRHNGNGCNDGQHSRREYLENAPHEVRCCSDKDLGNDWLKIDGCNNWAAAELKVSGSDPICNSGKSFSKAESICKENDSRLCTKTEVEEGCARDNGCSFNNEYVWTIESTSPTTSPTTSPYVKGDPHFMTWAGKTYDFHGVCDLVLVHVERFGKGIGMDIHIRSKKMKMWSFVASVAVCIGKDIFEVIGGKEPKVFTNGIEGKMKNTKDEISLTTTIAGFPVHRMNKSKKGEKFAINLGNNEKLVISTWHFFVSVSFENARSETFGDSVGLLGSFSGGMKLARDGTTIITDLNEYGQEWQVRDSEPHLFHSIEGPQYPLKCDIPSSTEMRHRLEESKLTTNEARKACDNVNQYELNLCIFDVLATNNKSTAGAY